MDKKFLLPFLSFIFLLIIPVISFAQVTETDCFSYYEFFSSLCRIKNFINFILFLRSSPDRGKRDVIDEFSGSGMLPEILPVVIFFPGNC